MMKRDHDLARKMLQIEKAHSITIGNVTIPAKVTKNLEVHGWVLPGGKFNYDFQSVVDIANRLNKAC